MSSSFTDPPLAGSTFRKKGANWLSWSLHLLLGLALGLLMGFVVWARLHRLRLVDEAQFPHIVCGLALLAGGFTSYMGDRAWFAPTVFAPEAPPQSRFSRAWSIIIGAAGIGIFGLALYRHYQAAAWHGTTRFRALNDVALLILLAIYGGLIVHILRTGSVFGRASRVGFPAAYWLCVAMLVLSAVMLLICLLG